MNDEGSTRSSRNVDPMPQAAACGMGDTFGVYGAKSGHRVKGFPLFVDAYNHALECSRVCSVEIVDERVNLLVLKVERRAK